MSGYTEALIRERKNDYLRLEQQRMRDRLTRIDHERADLIQHIQQTETELAQLAGSIVTPEAVYVGLGGYMKKLLNNPKNVEGIRSAIDIVGEELRSMLTGKEVKAKTVVSM